MELSEIAIALAETEARSENNTRRLEAVEKRQNEMDKLVTAVSVISKEQEHIKDDVGEIKTVVNSLAAAPGKRWDGLVDKALAVLVGAAIAWLLSGSPGV